MPAQLRNCCAEADVIAGESVLKARFAAASKDMASLGIKPVPIGKHGASCKNSSGDILLWLTPFPKCWQCYLELREKVHLGIKFADHQVIICDGYTKEGRKNEIMFDWWGDTMNGTQNSGGSPDKFRHEWPDNPFVPLDSRYNCTTDCQGNPTHPEKPGYPQPGKLHFPNCQTDT
jgi:hypothetical protein